jgi:hypothetical protein
MLFAQFNLQLNQSGIRPVAMLLNNSINGRASPRGGVRAGFVKSNNCMDNTVTVSG